MIFPNRKILERLENEIELTKILQEQLNDYSYKDIIHGDKLENIPSREMEDTFFPLGSKVQAFKIRYITSDIYNRLMIALDKFVCYLSPINFIIITGISFVYWQKLESKKEINIY